MNARWRQVVWSPWVIALVIGLAAVAYAVPLQMLNPLDVSWMNRHDTLQHWLGWEQFRHSPLLQLPLGKSELYGLEKSSTVVFSDSIPLAALLLHPIEGLLPTPFQYLGLWTALGFVLQSYFGYRLCLLVLRPAAAAAATVFFALATPMLYRMNVHTALFSQWVVVAGLYFYFAHEAWQWRRWALLISAASLIHGYLFAMVTMLWLAHLGKLVAMGALGGQGRGARAVAAAVARAAARALGVVLFVSLGMYLTGYFGWKNINHHLYGQARYDLLNLGCSYDVWSTTRFPVQCGASGSYDYDGQSFLGLGMITVVALALGGALVVALARRGRLDLSARLPRWPLVISCLVLVAFAATNRVVIGGREAFQIPVSRALLDAAETFRGSGRMAWPFFYAVMFGALALFARVMPARLHVWILLPLALYQARDSSNGIKLLHIKLADQPSLHEMRSPAWDQLSAYERLVSVPAEQAQWGWPDLVWQAAQRGLGSNIGYFNRSQWRREAAARARWVSSLVSGSFDPRTVYVLPDDRLWELAHDRQGPDDALVIADGHRLLLPGGARLGLVDAPYAPSAAAPVALSLGQWRDVRAGEEGARVLTFGWREYQRFGQWSDAQVAVLSLALPEEANGRAVPIALHFTEARVNRKQPAQRYRVVLQGRVLAEGAMGKEGGVVSFTAPPELTGGRALHLELQLPDATRMSPDGAFRALLLMHVWMGAGPDDRPPPVPLPTAAP